MGVMKVFSGNVAKSGEESRQNLIEPKTTINFAYVSGRLFLDLNLHAGFQ